MRLDGHAARKRKDADQATLRARYEHLLNLDGPVCRKRQRDAERAARRRYRQGDRKPAWKQRRRDVQADAASDAIISALVYTWLADRLEDDPKRAGATVGHRFTLKEIAALENRARDQATQHIDRIIRPRRPLNAHVQTDPPQAAAG